jgi:uncharacterized protein
MLRHILGLGLSCIATIALPSSEGVAASFNCGAATTKTEHAICNNAQLSRLDEQTSGMYYTIVGGGPPTATLNQVKSAQRNFIQQRDACGANFNCLVDAYTSQMMYLRQVKDELGL